MQYSTVRYGTVGAHWALEHWYVTLDPKRLYKSYIGKNSCMMVETIIIPPKLVFHRYPAEDPYPYRYPKFIPILVPDGVQCIGMV